MMGVRATVVGGEAFGADRRCGRSTAGAVGAVAVGAVYPLAYPMAYHYMVSVAQCTYR
eukprot:SAG11_NODE_47_length_20431_cov_7.472752_14_plen_58_part_00